MPCDAKIRNLVGETRIMTLRELEDMEFVGNPKWLTDGAKKRLKESIRSNNFAAPIFVGLGKILDGHQRLAVLRELISAGEYPDAIPVVEIAVKNEIDAAKLVLVFNTQYGHIEKDLLDTFIDLHHLDIGELRTMTDIVSTIKSPEKRESVPLSHGLELIVKFSDEGELREIYDELRGRGFDCRILTF